MFTGIIRQQGIVRNISRQEDAVELEIGLSTALNLKPGDSIAVDGACLTVLKLTERSFQVRLMKETLSKTTLGNLEKNSPLNVELPLRLGDAFDGHFVTGHIDGVATIRNITPAGSDKVFLFSLPENLSAYVVPKGAVALDGISLTVVEAESDYFSVSIMPYTLQHTTLGKKRPGDMVNLEVDMLGKYVVRFLERQQAKRNLIRAV